VLDLNLFTKKIIQIIFSKFSLNIHSSVVISINKSDLFCKNLLLNLSVEVKQSKKFASVLVRILLFALKRKQYFLLTWASADFLQGRTKLSLEGKHYLLKKYQDIVLLSQKKSKPYFFLGPFLPSSPPDAHNYRLLFLYEQYQIDFFVQLQYLDWIKECYT
jgi:hypothetical protein